MMPVAIGMGEGGEFYRPMAVAIIGGTITSTMLTLLVVPTFYDSIELSRERASAKYLARAERMNPFLAFMQTFGEAILTLVFVRFLYRFQYQLRLGRRDSPALRSQPRPSTPPGAPPEHTDTPIQAQARSPAAP
jgi:hydrophobic/amphiphilic exporter-1 (mainly G- bacteria), HAE1 family